MKKRGWMTEDQRDEYCKGKRTRGLLRESSGPQMEMTGPLQQVGLFLKAVRKMGFLHDETKTYSFAQTGTDLLGHPSVIQMLEDARRGEFDILLIAYGSRFCRDLGDAMDLLEELFALGVYVYFCKEQVLAGAERSWMKRIGRELVDAHIFSDELSEQREDTISSNWDKFKNNCGRPAWGYCWSRTTRPARIEKDGTAHNGQKLWERRAQLFREYATEKFTVGDLATKLNSEGFRTSNGRLFSKTTVHELLRNPIVKGVIRYHIGRDDAAEHQREDLRVVEDDLYDAVQQLMAARKRTRLSPRRVQHGHIFRDLVTCGACGAKFWSRLVSDGPGGYLLLHRRDHIVRTEPCRYASALVSENRLIRLVEAWLDALVLPPDACALVARYLNDRAGQPDIATTRRRLQERLDKAVEMCFEELITKAKLREIKTTIEAQLAGLPHQQAAPGPEAAEVIAEMGELWRRSGREERRALLRRLLLDIVVDLGEPSTGPLKKRRSWKGIRVTQYRVQPRYQELVEASLAYGELVRVEPTNPTKPTYRTAETDAWRTWLAEQGFPDEEAA